MATPWSGERDMAPKLLNLATRSTRLRLTEALVVLSSLVSGVLLIPSTSLGLRCCSRPMRMWIWMWTRYVLRRNKIRAALCRTWSVSVRQWLCKGAKTSFRCWRRCSELILLVFTFERIIFQEREKEIITELVLAIHAIHIGAQQLP